MGDSETPYRDFLREVSHYLRSPLSVVMGVVDDQLKGYVCSREDFEAAKGSLAKIRSMIEVFKVLGFSANIPQKTNLKDFFAARGSMDFSCGLKCSSFTFPEALEPSIDPVVLDGVLRIVFLVLRQKGHGSYAVEAFLEPDPGSGEAQKVVMHVYGSSLANTPSFQSESDPKSDASLALESERLQDIVWELVKTKYSHDQIDCCQYQDSEKNTHFNLTFK